MTEKEMKYRIKKTKKDEITNKKCLPNWRWFLLTIFMTKWQKESHRLASVALYRMISRLFIASERSNVMLFAP